MKLLFDHNLSPRLVKCLDDIYPDSSHVYFHALDIVDDVVIWEFARVNGYLLVTKDADFNDLSSLRGFPPKIIWLRIGNCRTKDVESVLRDHYELIVELEMDENLGILQMS